MTALWAELESLRRNEEWLSCDGCGETLELAPCQLCGAPRCGSCLTRAGVCEGHPGGSMP